MPPILDKVWRYCESSGIRGRTVTLKVKYADFSQATRSRTSMAPVASRDDLEQVSIALLLPVFSAPKGIRLLGVTLSSPNDEPTTLQAQLQLSM